MNELFELKNDFEVLELHEAENYGYVLTYRKSFIYNLSNTRAEVKERYYELFNNIMSHKNVRFKESFSYITFYNKLCPIARIKVRGNNLYLYLNLDVLDYLDAKFKIMDVSKYRKYKKLPLLLKIKGPKVYKYAFELLEDLYDKFALEDNFYISDDDSFIKKYLNRPKYVFLQEGYLKIVKRKMNLDDINRRLKSSLVTLNKVKIVATYLNDYLEVNNMYVVGSLPKVGSWDPLKSLEMKKVARNKFELDLLLPNCHLEFKILCGRNFGSVEKGMFNEEIVNHKYDINSDLIIYDNIYHFINEKDIIR